MAAARHRHTCHAHGCKLPVPERMLMCRTHWFSLRRAIRDAIWQEYRPGQEIEKDPSVRYLAVQQRAIGELAAKTSVKDATPYFVAAERWRQRAIDDGLGDPLAGLVQAS